MDIEHNPFLLTSTIDAGCGVRYIIFWPVSSEPVHAVSAVTYGGWEKWHS